MLEIMLGKYFHTILSHKRLQLVAFFQNKTRIRTLEEERIVVVSSGAFA